MSEDSTLCLRLYRVHRLLHVSLPSTAFTISNTVSSSFPPPFSLHPLIPSLFPISLHVWSIPTSSTSSGAVSRTSTLLPRTHVLVRRANPGCTLALLHYDVPCYTQTLHDVGLSDIEPRHDLLHLLYDNLSTEVLHYYKGHSGADVFMWVVRPKGPRGRFNIVRRT